MMYFFLLPLPSAGLPKPVIRWMRNGRRLRGDEPGVSILEDGTLLILASVSPLDDGEYVCAAANDAGSTERKYRLKVNGELSVLLTSDLQKTLLTLYLLSCSFHRVDCYSSR